MKTGRIGLWKRCASGMLAAVLLAGIFAGCGKGAAVQEEKEETNNDGVLTNIYDRVSGGDSSGMLNTSVRPFWDGEANTLTYITTVFEDAPSEDAEEEAVQYAVYTLVTLSEDGTSARAAVLDDREGLSLGCGMIDEGGITCAVYSTDGDNGRILISRYDLEAEQWTFGEDISGLFAQKPHALSGLRSDGDGDLYAASDREILILSPDGKKKGSVVPDISSGGQISGLYASPDGRIFAAVTYMNGGPEAAEIVKSSGTAGERIHVSGNMRDGDGDYLFFCSENDGVWGYRETADGLGKELILNYVNSGILWSESMFVGSAGGRMFFLEAESGAFYAGGTMTIYQPGEDIDLTDAKTLTIAYLDYLTTSMTSAVNKFRQDHPDVAVVLDDFGAYNTDENWRGGYDKLARDMATGLYKPDIVLGGLGAIHIKPLYEKGLYTDLTPFIEADDTVNRDNLFDCVERMFDDGHGGIWGTAANFTLQSLVSTPELLGAYAEQGCWTLEDVLDYIDGLPEDCEFMLGLNRDIHFLLRFGAYMEFVDREAGTCSFDDPVFIRYLNYVNTLPSYEEAASKSLYAGLDGDGQAEARISGKIRVTVGGNSGMLNDADRVRRLITAFGTKDWTMIGYPAPVRRAGAGISVGTQTAVVITSFCEEPELAWDLVRRSFSSKGGQGGIPALLSAFDEFLEKGDGWSNVSWYDTQFEDLYAYHGISGTSRPLSQAITEDEMEYPGILSTFTREDRDKYVKLFNEAGCTAKEAGVDEIYSILAEEMSAFLSGVGTAEECAAKIQSRVSLWLAENG